MAQRSPIHSLQKGRASAMMEPAGREMPPSYSDIGEEYEAATQGVGLADRSYVGRLKATGKDALDLLNRLSTNKLLGLTTGSGTSTVLTSNKGRILDLLLVNQMEDHLLLLTSPQNQKRVIEWIDFYTFLEEVSVEDVTVSTVMLSLMGPRALALLSKLANKEISLLPKFASIKMRIRDIEVIAMRTDAGGVPEYDLVAPALQGEALWKAIREEGNAFDLKTVGNEALETIRIEWGVPSFGRELGERFNPLEANMTESVSFDKGCYIGQEVVARLNTYKKVQRSLMGLVVDADTPLPPNAKLHVNGHEAGFITSSVRSILLGRPIALAFVKKAYAKPGTVLSAQLDGGESKARVVELPFKKD